MGKSRKNRRRVKVVIILMMSSEDEEKEKEEEHKKKKNEDNGNRAKKGEARIGWPYRVPIPLECHVLEAHGESSCTL